MILLSARRAGAEQAQSTAADIKADASAAGYTLGPPLGSQNPLKIECFSIKVLGSILSAKMPQNGSQN